MSFQIVLHLRHNSIYKCQSGKKECPLQTIDNGKHSYTVLSYVLVYEDVLA